MRADLRAICISMPAPLVKRLDAVAVLRGLSRSDIVRESLRRLLDAAEAEQQ